MNQLTKISLAWELFGEGINKTHIAQQLSVNRETVRIWINSIKDNPLGISGFIDDYLSAKKGERAKRKIDGLLKERICSLGEENRDCCGQKIHKYLQDEYGVKLSVPSIYKVLGERYQLRSKWKKNQARGPIPKAQAPREVIQMDSVDFGWVFAFTGIEGLNFLNQALVRFKHTNLLQTDGGSEFKDHFRSNVLKFTDRFRVARPYKKNEQSYIESFNRSLRKECLGWGKYTQKDIPVLQKEIDDYLEYYHTKRAHLSLGLKTPNDIIKEYRVSDI